MIWLVSGNVPNAILRLCCVHFKVTCIILHYLSDGLVYWGLTPQQQPGSYQGGAMMTMKSVIWWGYLSEVDLAPHTMFAMYYVCVCVEIVTYLLLPRV